MGDARIIPFDGAASGGRSPGRRAPARRTAQGRVGGPAAKTLPGAHGAAAEGEREPRADGDEVPVRERVPRGGAHGVRGSGGPAPGGADGTAGGAGAADDAAGAGRAARSSGQRPKRARPGSLAGAVGGAVGGAIGGLLDGLAGPGWEEKAADGLAFVRRRMTGDYEVDEFGFDPELNERLLAVLRVLYDKYFRVEVRGIGNIPAKGGALIVANHSGTLPLDALMTQVAVHDHHPGRRNLRLLAADLVFQVPVVGSVARKSGHTLACHADAERLLAKGELVGVWPEGYKGIGKPFGERYKLQRFGRGGFVASALRTGVPIVPCSIVGAEEIYPMIGNLRTVARLLGLPYFPVTPTFPLLGPLGLVPLPTRWRIEFGEPIRTDRYPEETAEDPMVVFNLTDEVRETIQHTIYRLLMQRRSVFF